MRWPVFVAMNKWKPGFMLIGGNHSIKFSYGDATHFEDKGWPHKEGDDGMDMVLVGLIENHMNPQGNACGGYVTFAKPLNPSPDEVAAETWEVHSLDPLTITPSLQCRSCPSHGFITDGKWVGP